MTTYRVVKTYLLFNDDDNGRELGMLAAILLYHRIWDHLTKPQRAALLADDRAAIRKITLDKLREQNLIDQNGATTIVGEAVLHYRPDGPIGHAVLQLEDAKASPPTRTREDGTR